MNVALSKYYEDFVADLIEGGRYGNSSEVVRAGNPSKIDIEGIRHLMYHGTSLDSIIAGMNKKLKNKQR